jgi:hypothetical protein
MAIAGALRLSEAGLSTPSPETIASLLRQPANRRYRVPAGMVADCRGKVPGRPASEATKSGATKSGATMSGITMSGAAVSETKGLRLPRAAFKEGSA